VRWGRNARRTTGRMELLLILALQVQTSNGEAEVQRTCRCFGYSERTNSERVGEGRNHGLYCLYTFSSHNTMLNGRIDRQQRTTFGSVTATSAVAGCTPSYLSRRSLIGTSLTKGRVHSVPMWETKHQSDDYGGSKICVTCVPLAGLPQGRKSRLMRAPAAVAGNLRRRVIGY
jgi:hypothetical protein